jgi:hypothetical protein
MKYVVLVALLGCSSPETPNPTPTTQSDAGPTFTTIVDEKAGLQSPTDLAFHPDRDELWIVDRATNGVHVVFAPGKSEQRVESRVDAYAQHFMPKPAALAFGVEGRFATCADSRNEWNEGPLTKPDDFMGPTLWTSDLSIFARVGQTFPKPSSAPEGSHLDMLHESPHCVGIAHEKDNVFWVFDGLHGNVVRYDFQKDHGPGGASHADGIVRRYPEVAVQRVEGVVGHMAIEGTSLYIADTGGGRVLRVDIASGASSGKLAPEELVAEYTKVEGVKVEVLANGLREPSGIAVHNGRVYVAEHESGDIVVIGGARIATGAKDLAGLAFHGDKLFFVDESGKRVVRVD